ncbi:MAG: aminotransferase class I/II-fold pyridoxal phosphate-dependent enzyme [Bacillota bacterium]
MNAKRKQKLGFNTLSIHQDDRQPLKALNPPIFMTSTFSFDSIEDADEVFSFEKDDFVYTRGNNPTLRLLEEKMAALENGAAGVAFGSGMGAISSTLLSLLAPGDEVLTHRTVYGSSYNVLKNILPRYQIEARFVNFTDLARVEGLISSKTKVFYFETPANPNLEIIDLAGVKEVARRYGIRIIVDNTFASPFFQNPLDYGADVVVHSATKYIAGFGAGLGGIAVSRDLDYIQELKFGYMCELGSVMSPFNGWLFLQGLKTLGLRMKQHEANAFEVAGYLVRHPKVEQVFYPGLPGFSGHEIAKKQMRGFGGMLSFELKGDLATSKKLINNFRLIKLAVSLGDAETLAEHPAAMTHRGYPREELNSFGLTETMIRLSVGLEDVADIIFDLEQALDKI